ncbi:MAG: T9SS type A sorting domain-containing protein [Flavobacteriales bacterium]|nr:T9SS type A sorting domain-containing protein [Flavobacteriales bacterium]
MKQHMLIFILTLSTSVIFAQEAISSGGDSFSGTTVGVDFTLGEPAIETHSGTVVMTQGFQQTKLQIIGVREIDQLELEVFPNPTSDYIQVSWVGGANAVTVDIFDLNGRLVKSERAQATNRLTIDLTDLQSGSYVVQVRQSNQINSSVLIQKF